MTKEEIKQLVDDYAYGLKNTIIKAFESYDLPFKWVSGWLPLQHRQDPVIVQGPAIFDNITGCQCCISIRLCGLNSSLVQEIKNNKDTKVIERFVIDVLDNYIAHETPEGFTVSYKRYWIIVNIDDNVVGHPDESGLSVLIDLELTYSGEVEE